MAITAELPIGTLSASERTGLVRTIWDEFAAKDLFPLAVFAVIGGAVALVLAITFPIPADIAAEWLVQFPG